ncbi:hypothetical protein AHAS_Ahas03G0225100 [Arachis hypogaea]
MRRRRLALSPSPLGPPSLVTPLGPPSRHHHYWVVIVSVPPRGEFAREGGDVERERAARGRGVLSNRRRHCRELGVVPPKLRRHPWSRRCASPSRGRAPRRGRTNWREEEASRLLRACHRHPHRDLSPPL